MKSYVLKHLKISSGCVVSKSIEVFLNRDNAILKSILLNKTVSEGESYEVETVEFNNSEFNYVERAGEELFIIDENRNTIDIDTKYVVDEFDSFQGLVKCVVYDTISIHGESLDSLDISEELSNEIRDVAVEAADELTENR